MKTAFWFGGKSGGVPFGTAINFLQLIRNNIYISGKRAKIVSFLPKVYI